MWAVPCYAVRCLEHVHTSIKMCVCIGRDGVQMVLPVGSQKETCLQLGVCLKVVPTLLGLSCEVSPPLCDEHVP